MMLEAALRYAAAGMRVIPVKPRGKLPLTEHGAHDSTTDEAQIRKWWTRWPDANIGLTLAGLVAVDIDPRNGGDIGNLPGKLPDTCLQKTGGGGWHHLLRANGGRYPGHLGPGIDVKTGPGAYILGEPSIHPSGERYSWLDESEPWAMQPAEAPAWLAQIEEPKAKPNGDGTIPGGARNSTLTSMAGAMQRRGMTQDAILAALRAENAARCDPPLPDGDVQKIAKSVGRYEPAGDTRPHEPPPEPIWPEPLDLEALAARDPEAPQHIIPGWLPAGEVALFAGHGGAGKSAIALYLAVCIALGAQWFGLACACRRVLYVSAEDPPSVVHWRLARICAHLGVAIGDLKGKLTVIDASRMDAELMIDTREEPIFTALYSELAAMMKQPDGPEVVVLDGASDLYGSSEILRRHVRRFIRGLRRLVPPNGAAILLGHIDKAIARGKETGDHYSGSTAWNNSVRARWALKPDGDDLVLRLEKANHAKPGAEIRLRWDQQAHMHLADAAQPAGVVGTIKERLQREGILAAMRCCAAAGIAVPAATTGQRTAYHVLKAQPEFPPSLSGDTPAIRKEFWAQIEQLRVLKSVGDTTIRANHNHKVSVLELLKGAS